MISSNVVPTARIQRKAALAGCHVQVLSSSTQNRSCGTVLILKSVSSIHEDAAVWPCGICDGAVEGEIVSDCHSELGLVILLAEVMRLVTK
jgi:hypothetical protein